MNQSKRLTLADLFEVETCEVCNGSKLMPILGSAKLVKRVKKDTKDRPCGRCQGSGKLTLLKHPV